MTKVQRFIAITITIAIAITVYFLAPLSLLASDLSHLLIVGNVSKVEIIRSSGSYLETLLYVWSYEPSATLQPIILRCNGNAGGTLTNCLYPSAFLGCSQTVTTTADIYEPTLTYERHICTPPARRDAGACVSLLAQPRPLDTFLYQMFANNHTKIIQALSLDVLNVDYAFDCTSKQ